MMMNDNQTQPSHTASSLRDVLLQMRYLRRSSDDRRMETECDMYWRVANTIAAVEGRYGKTQDEIREWSRVFFAMLSSKRFLPNSPTLMNAGQDTGVLSACYVLPIDDSIESIFEAVKNTARIQKAGGGTGFSFDRLRPAGDDVTSSGGTTSGPLSFMKVLSETSHAIQQGALRRGANMAVMSIDHPDVMKFITAKHRADIFTNFNISIKISDKFMEKLETSSHADHVVINPRTQERYLLPKTLDRQSYQLNDLVPIDQKSDSSQYMTVQDVWDEIVRNAHATGEPGIVYIDRINDANPVPHVGSIDAVNPCGEQPLLDYECCNLGSINLSAFVLDNRCDMDWAKLTRLIKDAVRFLDNVIDANHWPIKEIQEISQGNRKIGLGLMGVADTLILLGIRYDSEEAVEFCDRVASHLQQEARGYSQILAAERGHYPNWPGSLGDRQGLPAMRNATCTTLAPTGSISILAECSNGIEPVFTWCTRRRAIEGQEFIQVHPLLERIGTEEGWLDDKAKEMLADGHPIQKISGISGDLLDKLVSAHEISHQWHVKIQAAFQRHIDNGVSKTVNIPSDTAAMDVDQIFRHAFELGCKGITVYRDGSRPGQVVSVANKQNCLSQGENELRPRPNITTGQTSKYRMGCGTLFVTVNQDDHGICEVFANLGKAGGCPSQSEATCRVVSAALRSGVSPGILIDQLRNIRCLSAIVASKKDPCVSVLSCPDAIGKALSDAVNRGHVQGNDPVVLNTCPECGGHLRKESGCIQCSRCGFNKCG